MPTPYPHQEIKAALEQIQLIGPNKSLVESEWFASLIGVGVGFVLGLISVFVADYFKKQALKRAMCINIFDEVFLNRAHTDEESTEKVENTLSQFTTISAATSRPSSGVSIQDMGIIHIDYYNAYYKDFNIFNQNLRERLSHFYGLVKSVSATSKKLETYFRDWYAGSGVIGSVDIQNLMRKLIMQMQSTHRVGTEILVIFMKDYSYTGRLPKIDAEDVEYINLKINQYLVGKKDKVVTIDDLSKAVGVSDLAVATAIYRSPNLEKTGNYGFYKVLSA